MLAGFNNTVKNATAETGELKGCIE